MKKSELKKELEVAKATLELAMVALRLAAEKNKELNSKESQAGDKIVESNNSDWFIKNDDGSYTIKLSTGANFEKWDTQIQKETPLADLNKEVEIEKQANELINHFMPLVNGWVKAERLEINCTHGSDRSLKIDSTNIPFENWSCSIPNQRKAAIRCAIKHCELKNEFITFESDRNNEAIKSQLQKMLSE